MSQALCQVLYVSFVLFNYELVAWRMTIILHLQATLWGWESFSNSVDVPQLLMTESMFSTGLLPSQRRMEELRSTFKRLICRFQILETWLELQLLYFFTWNRLWLECFWMFKMAKWAPPKLWRRSSAPKVSWTPVMRGRCLTSSVPFDSILGPR